MILAETSRTFLQNHSPDTLIIYTTFFTRLIIADTSCGGSVSGARMQRSRFNAQMIHFFLIPYTAKLSSEKTFAVFTVFQPIAKVFPLNHLLCTVHNGMGLMHRESFPVNGVFCAQPRKFSSLKVLLYTVSNFFVNEKDSLIASFGGV